METGLQRPSKRNYVRIDGKVLTSDETILEQKEAKRKREEKQRKREEAKDRKRKRQEESTSSKLRRTKKVKERDDPLPDFPSLIIRIDPEEGGEVEEEEILEEGVVERIVPSLNVSQEEIKRALTPSKYYL